MMVDQGDFFSVAHKHEYQRVRQHLDLRSEVQFSPRIVIEAAVVNYEPKMLLRDTSTTLVYRASTSSTGNQFDDRYLPREVAVKFPLSHEPTDEVKSKISDSEKKKRGSFFKTECHFVLQHLLHQPEDKFEFVACYYGLTLPENRPGHCVGPVGLVMEYLPHTLGEFLKTQSAKDDDDFRYINKVQMALGIANGLKALHSRHPPIVHCSLCAENVLLTPGKQPKIANFDQALLADGRTECPKSLVPVRSQTRKLKAKYDMYGYAKLLLHIETYKEPSSSHTPVDMMKKGKVLYEVAFTKVLNCEYVTNYLSADEALSMLQIGYDEISKDSAYMYAVTASSSVPGRNQNESSGVNVYNGLQDEYRSHSVPAGNDSVMPTDATWSEGISSGYSTDPLNHHSVRKPHSINRPLRTPVSSYPSAAEISPRTSVSSHPPAAEISPRAPVSSYPSAAEISPRAPVSSHPAAAEISPRAPVSSHPPAADISPRAPVSSYPSAAEISPKTSVSSHPPAAESSPRAPVSSHPPAAEISPRTQAVQPNHSGPIPTPEKHRERATPGNGATFNEEPIAQDPELDGTDEENPEKRHGRSNIKPKRNFKLEEDARMDYLRKVLF